MKVHRSIKLLHYLIWRPSVRSGRQCYKSLSVDVFYDAVLNKMDIKCKWTCSNTAIKPRKCQTQDTGTTIPQSEPWGQSVPSAGTSVCWMLHIRFYWSNSVTWSRGLSSGNALNFRLFVSSQGAHLHQITHYCHVRETLFSNSCQSWNVMVLCFEQGWLGLSFLYLKNSCLVLPAYYTVLGICKC